MILVTGGAGFIGANFVLDWLERTDEPVVNLDKLTYAGNLGSLAALRGDVAARVRPRRHRRPRAGRCAARAAPPARHRQFRGREPRRPVDPRAGGVRRDQRRRHVPPARGDPRLLGRAARGRARRVPLSPRLDRRGVRLARSGRPAVHRNDALRAEQPLLGLEGRGRPPRARLSPHLRAADAHDQLLEQLRAVPVSGEAHPADDRQRPRGQAAAGVRRRPQRPRLALCRRSLRGDPRGARGRPPGRDLQYRRQCGDDQSRRRRARSAGSSPSSRRAATTRA